MSDMTVSEFVSKVIKDRDFLLEVCKNIPEELLKEEQETESGHFGLAMAKYFYAATQAMGYDFDEAGFGEECERQMNSMGGFAKVKFAGRFIRTLSKADKGKKK